MPGSPERNPQVLFAPARVRAVSRGGELLLQSPLALADAGRCVGDDLERWAKAAPGRTFLVERDATGHWTGVTYGQARESVWRLGAALLASGLSAERPLAILSDNGVEHGLLTLAAMHVGIPALPISSAYSLVSKDFAKLKSVFELMTPGAVYVSDARFQAALDAVAPSWTGPVIAGRAGVAVAGHPGVSFAQLQETADPAGVAEAFARVGPDTIAKFLLTSGSTGEPKAVINTQRMLTASQQAKTQVWPFLERTPPVLVDWLPWNHTFGGNHNFHMVLRHGGTLYIDGGRPAPGLFDTTLLNLAEIAPTIYLNVPRGFDMLVAALRRDESLRQQFFSRLQVIFYAAAALPQNLWDALIELSVETLGHPIAMVSAWGSTETAPLATDCHFTAERAGVIGLPVPGVELKLVANGEKQEIRVRGPNVTPGYWRRPELTAAAFDAEGFYRIGDAVRLVDPLVPERGLLFDGRVAEDFKLASGTWVNVGMLRIAALAALAPIAQDAVVTGHDRSELGLLVFANLAACRALAPELGAQASGAEVLACAAVREKFAHALAAFAEGAVGSASRVGRALLMAEAPQIDAGEITDKGYVNQRAVLARRALEVALLYEEPPHARVIRV